MPSPSPAPLLKPLAALLAAVLALGPGDAAAQTTDTEPTLRERLVFGLQVRRPSEFAFIDAVVDTVERGDLPERLVDRFFFYARQRTQNRSRTRRPIIDFQFALSTAAERLRIEIRADAP